MQRYDYLKAIASHAEDALAVCTGWAAREWWALRPGEGNLKTRTLGLVSSIAAGLAIALPHRKVIAIDGDGAVDPLHHIAQVRRDRRVGIVSATGLRAGQAIHILGDQRREAPHVELTVQEERCDVGAV